MKIKTWDGNSLNDSNYETILGDSFFGWQNSPLMVSRSGNDPVITDINLAGRLVPATIYIRGGTYAELAGWLDPRDKQIKTLVFEDAGGGNDRSLSAICIELAEIPFSAGKVFTALFQISGDITPEAVTADIDNWAVTGTGDQEVINNAGDTLTLPILEIMPTSGKTGSWDYRRWLAVLWNSPESAVNYPVNITADSLDTATLVTGGKMQADGDDLRVLLDGVEVDRWLKDINTAATGVWISMDFKPAQVYTLTNSLTAVETVTELEVDESLANAPNSGILLIGNEAFTFTGKNVYLNKFTGVQRAARGTTAAAHTGGDPVDWVQHDIFVKYGNSGAAAPVLDAGKAPAFTYGNVNSDNDRWVYNGSFGDSGGARPGRWSPYILGAGEYYTGNHGTNADPWDDIGGGTPVAPNSRGGWQIYNPCGLVTADIQGERYADANVNNFDAALESSPDRAVWNLEFDIPAPATADTWDSWSRTETLDTGAKAFRFWANNSLTGKKDTPLNAIECNVIDLTLNSSNTPTVNLAGAEQNNYDLDCTIENLLTGDRIRLRYSMVLNETLTVDTKAKTITGGDGLGAYYALTLLDNLRLNWLPLMPGNNTLEYVESGVAAVTVTVTHRSRHYD